MKKVDFSVYFTYIPAASAVETPTALSSHGLANSKISNGLQTNATLTCGLIAFTYYQFNFR